MFLINDLHATMQTFNHSSKIIWYLLLFFTVYPCQAILEPWRVKQLKTDSMLYQINNRDLLF